MKVPELQAMLEALQQDITSQLVASEAPGGDHKAGITIRMVITGDGDYQTAYDQHTLIKKRATVVGDATFSITAQNGQFSYLIVTSLETAGLESYLVSIAEMCTLFYNARLFDTLKLQVRVEAAYIFAMASNGHWLELLDR